MSSVASVSSVSSVSYVSSVYRVYSVYSVYSVYIVSNVASVSSVSSVAWVYIPITLKYRVYMSLTLGQGCIFLALHYKGVYFSVKDRGMFSFNP